MSAVRPISEGTDDDMIFRALYHRPAHQQDQRQLLRRGSGTSDERCRSRAKNLLVVGIESILHAEDGYFITSLSEMLEHHDRHDQHGGGDR